MNKKDLTDKERDVIIDKLRLDEHYYGDYGKKFLSNSDISKLINNPHEFHSPTTPNINLLMGGAFHTMILEPEKMVNYKVVKASNRATKVYKAAEKVAGEMLLLESDIEKLRWMKGIIDNNDHIQSIMKGDNVEYEVPGFGEVYGELWKGKADIINHDEKLVVDLKTTSDISKFGLSAIRYNYNSQAYIYRELFGYDVVFIALDKKTGVPGFYDCSDNFYRDGRDKVIQAVHSFRLYHKDQNPFDWKNYLITDTL